MLAGGNFNCNPKRLRSLSSSPEGQMAQWVKGLASKPDDLSLTHGTHIVKGEKLRRQRQVDLREFEASLVYTA